MIKPELWKITLPMFKPTDLMDNSTIAEYQSCPRKGLYRYGLRRGFGGKSFAIQYGTAYHKYRQTVEELMVESGIEGAAALTDEVHKRGQLACLEGFEEPPVGNRHEHLGAIRLLSATEMAKKRIIEERRTGRVIVTRTEDSFDLELDWWLCIQCGHTYLHQEVEKFLDANPSISRIHPPCPNCEHELIRAHHGGRVDQFTFFSTINANLIRDFKTTSFKGPSYEEKFDPNAQMQGYVWAGSKLSGRNFDGVLIETVYNTKTKGPEITQHYVQYSQGQIEQWEASMMMERSFLMQSWAQVDNLGYLAFPQRTTHCSAYGGCPYRNACRSGSGWEIEQWLENYTIYTEWDFMSPETEESQV